MPKEKPMTPTAAARIQAAEAKGHGGKVSSGSFAARAQRAAAAPAPAANVAAPKGKGGKK